MEDAMGTVLSFHRGHRPYRTPMRLGAGRPAGWGEVVIFPGIRIERHDETACGLDLATRIGRKQEGSSFRGQDPEPGRHH